MRGSGLGCCRHEQMFVHGARISGLPVPSARPNGRPFSLHTGLITRPITRPAQLVHVFPFDLAWGPSIDSKTLTETLPQNFFAFSIIPYAGFLFHLTKSKKLPGMSVFGFYFLLVFVFATIPAGIYAKTVYHTSLANVDWLHGSAESLLTITNLFIVLGLRQAIQEEENKKKSIDSSVSAEADQDAAASQQTRQQ